MAELDYKRLRDRLRGRPVAPVESKLPIGVSDVTNTLGGFKVDPKAIARPNESTLGYMGRRIRESVADTMEPINRAVSTVGTGIGQFMTGLSGEQPTTPAALAPFPVEESARQQRIAAPNTIIRVGAATDAEAARNLQSRAEQDAAVANRVASYDRATETLRDLRAERMGIPRSVLDVSEGRASPAAQAAPKRNPFALPGDKFGDDVMRRNRLMSAIKNPDGKTPGEKKRNQLAAVETFKSFMEGGQQPAAKSNEVNPIDMGRFLLEQKKAESQLGLDKARLNIEQGTLAVKQTEARAKQQEYNDKARKEFMETAQLPEGILPEYQSQILSSIDLMSQSTGGVIPREVMLADYLKFAEENNVNFKDMKSTNMLDLNKKFMAYQTSRYGSK